MAKYLFGLEEDIATKVEALQTSPEEGEAAAIQAEMESEGSEVNDAIGTVESGEEATGELEQVEALVQSAVEDGEGISPIAAEAIAMAISAIAAKVGANPRSVFALYAAENFQSGSSAKSNLKPALEGVQEFLKDMATKIKLALKKLWAKLKSFWDKHVSVSGKMVKAIESMKNKVKATSGKISGKAYLDKAPAAVASYYKTDKDVNISVVRNHLLDPAMIKTMTGRNENFANTVTNIAKSAAGDSAKVDHALQEMLKGHDVRDFEFPVTGGEVVSFEFTQDADEGTISMKMNRERAENIQDSPGMAVADKASLLSLLNDAQALIRSVTAAQKNSEKSAQKFNEAMSVIEQLVGRGQAGAAAKDVVAAAIGGQGGDPDIVRKLLRLIYKGSTIAGKMEAFIITESIRSCKGVLTYTAACLKQYS